MTRKKNGGVRTFAQLHKKPLHKKPGPLLLMTVKLAAESQNHSLLRLFVLFLPAGTMGYAVRVLFSWMCEPFRASQLRIMNLFGLLCSETIWKCEPYPAGHGSHFRKEDERSNFLLGSLCMDATGMVHTFQVQRSRIDGRCHCKT